VLVSECDGYAARAWPIGGLTSGAAGPRRASSARPRAKSVGPHIACPQQSLPSSMAGSQKQLSPIGKQRNAVTGNPAKLAINPKPLPSGRRIWLSTTSTPRDFKNSSAARMVPAKWHRNPHWRSRSVVACASIWGPSPTKSTSILVFVMDFLLRVPAPSLQANLSNALSGRVSGARYSHSTVWSSAKSQLSLPTEETYTTFQRGEV
jgi:hypothetical protein